MSKLSEIALSGISPILAIIFYAGCVTYPRCSLAGMVKSICRQ